MLELSIERTAFEADSAFVADLQCALCSYHGRIIEQFGKSGDMQDDVILATNLLGVNDAYAGLCRLIGEET